MPVVRKYNATFDAHSLDRNARGLPHVRDRFRADAYPDAAHNSNTSNRANINTCSFTWSNANHVTNFDSDHRADCDGYADLHCVADTRRHKSACEILLALIALRPVQDHVLLFNGR
jgi:hypothetical protein